MTDPKVWEEISREIVEEFTRIFPHQKFFYEIMEQSPIEALERIQRWVGDWIPNATHKDMYEVMIRVIIYVNERGD